MNKRSSPVREGQRRLRPPTSDVVLRAGPVLAVGMTMNASRPALPGSASRVYEAGVNHEVLCVEFGGHVTAEAMRHVLEAVRERLPALHPGFSALVDLTRLEKMEIESAPYLAVMMEAFRAAAIGQVVRVVPDPTKDIGLNILSAIHYRGRVPVATVRSLTEAATRLGH